MTDAASRVSLSGRSGKCRNRTKPRIFAALEDVSGPAQKEGCTQEGDLDDARPPTSKSLSRRAPLPTLPGQDEEAAVWHRIPRFMR
jgi:hypothetical protein